MKKIQSQQSKITGIFGPQGSGKTTLLQRLCESYQDVVLIDGMPRNGVFPKEVLCAKVLAIEGISDYYSMESLFRIFESQELFVYTKKRDSNLGDTVCNIKTMDIIFTTQMPIWECPFKIHSDHEHMIILSKSDRVNK